MSRLAYLDTSAFVKLPLREEEADALRRDLAPFDGFVSSDLLRVEARRVGLRYTRAAAARIERALEGVALLPIDAAVVDAAGRLPPASVRSLDAVHLATALSLGDDLAALFTYDERLADAAREHGVTVIAPA